MQRPVARLHEHAVYVDAHLFLCQSTAANSRINHRHVGSWEHGYVDGCDGTTAAGGGGVKNLSCEPDLPVLGIGVLQIEAAGKNDGLVARSENLAVQGG